VKTYTLFFQDKPTTIKAASPMHGLRTFAASLGFQSVAQMIAKHDVYITGHDVKRS